MDIEIYNKFKEVGAIIASKLTPTQKINLDGPDSFRVWQAEFDEIMVAQGLFLSQHGDDMVREAIYVGIHEAVESE